MANIKKIGNNYYDMDAGGNKSVLQTCYELKTLGIKNWYFPLIIYDPRAAMIDPWKKNITAQEVEVLMMEASKNIWYYIRELVRMPTTGGVVPFGLHRGLAAVIYLFTIHYDSCLCIPRQCWKTTGVLASIFTWAFQVGARNSTIMFFNRSLGKNKENLANVQEYVKLLPEWLQLRKYTDNQGKIRKAKESSEVFENKVTGNKIMITPEAVSESKAISMGRGSSVPFIYGDEIEFTPHFDLIFSNSGPAFKTAADTAKAAGKPFGRIYTSTPGNLDTKEGRAAMPIIQSMVPFTEKIYDWSDEQIQDYISTFVEEYHADASIKREREVVEVFYVEFQYHQIRKSHKWVEEQYKLTGDRLAIRREILLQRLRGSSSSPIDPEVLEYLIQHMQKSINDIMLNTRWRMITYPHGQNPRSTFDSNIPYIIGVDPAGGGGGDFTSITVVNPLNLQIAAEFRSPYISGTELVRVLIDLINNYIPNGVIIPERNSMGIYLIHDLCETSIKDNLYWSESKRQLEDLIDENAADSELKRMSVQYKKYGTYTIGKNREAMFELLFKHIAECKEILNTEYLVDHMCKLIRNSTGKILADKGEHDDCVMSYLHAIFIYYTGDNLEFFGIHRSEHPILGALEPNYEETMASKDTFGWSSSGDVSFEQIELMHIIENEQLRKALVQANKNVYDPVYSNVADDSLYDDLTDIPPIFFDQINGF